MEDARACPFCSLLEHGLPAHTLYEGKATFVLLDRDSLGLGHCMVIPRRHAQQLQELPESEYTEVFGLARRLGPQLLKATKKKAVGMVAFGSGIPHAHLHLVPNDHPSELLRPHGTELTDEQLAANAALLRPFVKDLR